MARESIHASTKPCTKCGESKPRDRKHFGKCSRVKDGLRAQCRECEAADKARRRAQDPGQDRRYYEQNKDWLLPKMNKRARERRKERGDEVRAKFAEWRARNKEKISEYQTRYYWRNRESERERVKSYYLDNPEKRSERNKKIEDWRKQNREKSRCYVRNRRALIRQSPGDHSAEDVQRQLEYQMFSCFWCGSELNGSYHVDHVIPISRGGSNGPENIVAACRQCNQEKSDKMPWEL